MAVQNEGNGVSYTFSGITLDPISMQIPGFTAEAIDLTTLSNTSVRTYITSTLKDYQPFTLTTEMDPDLVDGMPAGGEGGSFVITFDDSSYITLYANLLSMDNVDLENSVRPVFSMTFQPTNLNSGSETAPAYTAPA